MNDFRNTKSCFAIYRILHLVPYFMVIIPLLASCNAAPSTPDKAAELFLHSLQDGRFSDALRLSDDDSKPVVLAIESISRDLPPEQRAIVSGVPNGDLHITGTKITGPNADVSYSVGGGPNEVLRVASNNGVWKVRFQGRNIFP